MLTAQKSYSFFGCFTGLQALVLTIIRIQGCVRLLAWSGGLPDCVLQELDSPRAAPAPHRAAGLGPPASLCPEQPCLPVHVLLLPLQPLTDTGTMAFLDSLPETLPS